jgi:hypothetical protein
MTGLETLAYDPLARPKRLKPFSRKTLHVIGHVEIRAESDGGTDGLGDDGALQALVLAEAGSVSLSSKYPCCRSSKIGPLLLAPP